MKGEFCKYCGTKNLNGHHCSGKKAYLKGWNDCELSKQNIPKAVEEIDKIVEKL